MWKKYTIFEFSGKKLILPRIDRRQTEITIKEGRESKSNINCELQLAMEGILAEF